MRIIDRSGGKELKDLSTEQLTDLGTWRREERMRSDSARNAIERGWMDDLRMYNGIPPSNARNIPIEMAPNIEITLGAIAVDGIFSNWIELITQSTQLITVLPRKKYEDYSDAVQDWIDWGCREAFNIEEAINVAAFDCIRLGPMALYIPYVEKVKVTDTMKVIDRGPRIKTLVIEDFHLVEGSAGNIQDDQWVSMDMWLTSSDLEMYKKKAGWNLEGVEPAANVSEVTQKRYDVSQEESNKAVHGGLYQIEYCCCQYDIDNDGIDEELEVIWDVTSGLVMKVSYPKYDLRPFEFAVYQITPGVAWGQGVERMCAPFEEETSVIHNERTLNMRLANARIWRAAPAISAFLDKIWPGKVVKANAGDFEGVKMADIYSSSPQGEMMTVAFAERRTGVSDLQAQASRMGTRTPGFTASTYMQAANRRFTPPYRNMRLCIANAVRQCLYRVQERIRNGDKAATDDVMAVLGDEKGQKFVELMKKVDNLIDAVDIQVTASSVSINRDADRQNLMGLMQLWKDWQKSRLELQQMATMAPTQELKELAGEIEKAAVNLLRRYMRTFEILGDVDKYLAEVRGFEELAGQAPPQIAKGLQGIAAQLGQAAQNGAPPQQPPPDDGGQPPVMQ